MQLGITLFMPVVIHRMSQSRAAKKSSVPILDLFGQAVGVIGISYNDFCRCTPDELEAIFKAYGEAQSEREKDAWERMRISTAIGVQPHVKRKITPKSLIPLPWDNKNKAAAQSATAENMSPEDRKRRFERLSNITN